MRLKTSILAACVVFAPVAAMAQAVEHALYIPPLDTSAVSLEPGLKMESLDNLEPSSGEGGTRRKGSPESRVTRVFHPLFGAAVARAVRRVEAIDSSAASFVPPLRRVLLHDGQGDSLFFHLPPPTADSARYMLVLGRLDLGETTENLPRRFVPPSEPEFDPTTGTMRPGNRKGYSEGPGKVTSLTARAYWLLWDARDQAVARRGVARGKAPVRGEPGRLQWEELARDLAKEVVAKTAFSPY